MDESVMRAISQIPFLKDGEGYFIFTTYLKKISKNPLRQ